MESNERSPLITIVRIAPPRQRYQNIVIRRFFAFAFGSTLILVVLLVLLRRRPVVDTQICHSSLGTSNAYASAKALNNNIDDFCQDVTKGGSRSNSWEAPIAECDLEGGGKTIAGAFVPGGYLISVPTVAIHHNPTIYRDPHSFRPERWLAGDAAELSDYFVPFSVGPRACVGRNFAWMEMAKTLATIFRLFRFERITNTASKTRKGFFVKVEECNVRISVREA
ncbi:hypothetical protein V502_10043, partial [Pseudogymnoascus sp. VKM F-4520 (FW-2644)]